MVPAKPQPFTKRRPTRDELIDCMEAQSALIERLIKAFRELRNCRGESADCKMCAACLMWIELHSFETGSQKAAEVSPPDIGQPGSIALGEKP